ncbi:MULTISPECIES: ABC transporter ATP-binding protein [Streptococcus]|uniref:ABC transporter ATP-binding protein n=1 Tax=Streptococcus TaxID=1301 RepID=UPI002001CCEF|nr:MULTISPECIES: ABC transporter ATP-binding protein [Streptococcus]MDU2559794.1 ABC transporter ATP-binding protein [Streptococcus mitis]
MKNIIKMNFGYFCIASLLTVLSVGFEIAVAIILMLILNSASDGSLNKLISILVVGVLVLVVNVIFSYLLRYYRNNIIFRIMCNYKEYIFRKILNLNTNSFNTSKTGRFISALNNDVNSIEINLVESYFTILKLITLLICGIVSMAILNIRICIIVLLLSILPLAVSLIFSKKVQNSEKNVSLVNELYTSSIKDMLSGFSVVKSFNAEDEILNVFNKVNLNVETEKRHRRNNITNIEIWTNFIGYFVVMAMMGIGGYLAIKGELKVGTLLAFIQLFNYIITPFEKLPTVISKYKAADELITKINDYLIENNDSNLILKKQFDNKIEICNVTFGYDNNEDVLKNLNFTFEKGKSYAIVGTSGSGKTTLLNILLGINKPNEGSVQIDGVSVSSISPQNISDLFSVVQQNVFIFDTTIENNVTMYKHFDQDIVNKAIKFSGLSNICNARGTRYMCGENGKNLSGGEKQKVSIARTLIKQTPIIIMDEATASLDTETTFEVENAILDLKNTTRIIVTHKLYSNMLKKYDKILVLKNGRIIEDGKFDELLRERGYFYMLYSCMQE